MVIPPRVTTIAVTCSHSRQCHVSTPANPLPSLTPHARLTLTGLGRGYYVNLALVLVITLQAGYSVTLQVACHVPHGACHSGIVTLTYGSSWQHHATLTPVRATLALIYVLGAPWHSRVRGQDGPKRAWAWLT